MNKGDGQRSGSLFRGATLEHTSARKKTRSAGTKASQALLPQPPTFSRGLESRGSEPLLSRKGNNCPYGSALESGSSVLPTPKTGPELATQDRQGQLPPVRPRVHPDCRFGKGPRSFVPNADPPARAARLPANVSRSARPARAARLSRPSRGASEGPRERPRGPRGARGLAGRPPHRHTPGAPHGTGPRSRGHAPREGWGTWGHAGGGTRGRGGQTRGRLGNAGGGRGARRPRTGGRRGEAGGAPERRGRPPEEGSRRSGPGEGRRTERREGWGGATPPPATGRAEGGGEGGSTSGLGRPARSGCLGRDLQLLRRPSPVRSPAAPPDRRRRKHPPPHCACARNGPTARAPESGS